ncbi:hypothetical protein AVEN_8972-1, partial [Araneus ventricosus]
VHNVYKRDTGFIVSGSCTISRSGGGYDVHNSGSRVCHLTYGDCSGSTSSGGGRSIQKIHNVYLAGSGDFFITYCGASTSSEEMIHNVYNGASGNFYIMYVTNDTNIHRRLVNDVRKGGSGSINITYKNCGSRNICGKLANDIYIGGSGSVNVSTSSDKSCGPLVNNVHEAGSGRIYLQYGTEDCEKSFNSLKQAMTTSPVLTYPRTNKEFILDTVASNEGTGAVLSQKIGNEECVIAYFSRSLEDRPSCQEFAPENSAAKRYWALWDSLHLKDGVLYRKRASDDGRSCRWQLILPKSRFQEVLRETHDSASGGHCEVMRTLSKTRERFYWDRLHADVEKWCRE